MPTPLLPAIPRSELPPRWREAAETAQAVRGEATLIETLANAPELLDWYYDQFYGKLFFAGRVDRRTKELLRLRLSTRHGCAYCNRGNGRSALAGGLTDEQVARIDDADSPCFDDRDRAVLRLADEIALPNMDGSLTPDLYAALRRHFDEAAIVELGMVAAILTGMAKLLFVFDLVSREANCPIGPARS